MAEKMKKRIIVGATGASGLPLLVKCLEIIRENSDFESYLIMSSSAELTLRQETELEPEDVKRLADHVCAPGEIGVVILLCSSIRYADIPNSANCFNKPILARV